ncbi:MAG: MvdC/MvdD family ATP grasp protein [Pseudonocardiaceae bacterium]
MSVLILAEQLDVSADQMVLALTGRGVDVHRIDLAWFPLQLSIDAELQGDRWVGRLTTPHRQVKLEELRAVWYRSPATFQFPAQLSQADKQHCHIEAKLGLGGVLLSLPVLFVNNPSRQAEAVYKPRQLAAAAQSGLTVPATLVASTEPAVRRFVTAQAGEAVTKMFGSNSIVDDDRRKVAFTRRLTPTDLVDLHGIDLTAHQLQRLIYPKAHDARLVVIGDRQFGFTIHGSTPETRLDFRYDYSALRYEPIEVPHDVAKGVTRLMSTLGLMFASIDFVVRPTGEWVFIGDVNPGGQYGWLEAATGVPLTDCLADLLVCGAAP